MNGFCDFLVLVSLIPRLTGNLYSPKFLIDEYKNILFFEKVTIVAICSLNGA